MKLHSITLMVSETILPKVTKDGFKIQVVVGMEEHELVVRFQVDVLYKRVLVHVFHGLAEFNPDSFDVICGYSRYRCPVDFKTRKPPFVTHSLVDIPFLIQPKVTLPFVS